MSIFLIDVAEFNKQLNAKVRGFFRNIGGKIIPVKSHSRRYVMATRQALKDLQKRGKKGFEGAYLIDPNTGYVGNYTVGNSGAVDPYDNMRFKGDIKDVNDYVKHGQKSKRYILHNHPTTTSLSSPDIFYSTARNQTYAINENGSVFRGYKLKDYDMDLHSSQSIEIFAEMAEKYPNAKQTELAFLSSHLANKKMQNEGLIFYRSKLSKVDRKTIDKYKSFVDDVLRKPLYDTSLPITSNVSEKTRGKIEAMDKISTINFLKRLQLKNLSKRQKQKAIREFIKNESWAYKNIVGLRTQLKDYTNQLNNIEKELKSDKLDDWSRSFLESQYEELLGDIESQKSFINEWRPHLKKEVNDVVRRAKERGYF